ITNRDAADASSKVFRNRKTPAPRPAGLAVRIHEAGHRDLSSDGLIPGSAARVAPAAITNVSNAAANRRTGDGGGMAVSNGDRSPIARAWRPPFYGSTLVGAKPERHVGAADPADRENRPADSRLPVPHHRLPADGQASAGAAQSFRSRRALDPLE